MINDEEERITLNKIEQVLTEFGWTINDKDLYGPSFDRFADILLEYRDAVKLQ